MFNRNCLIFLITLVYFVSPVSTQAPQSGGVDDNEWINPKGVSKSTSSSSSSVCKTVNLRSLSGTCTSNVERTWGSARFPQFSYDGDSSSTIPVTSRPSAREISNIVFSQSGQNTASQLRLNLLFVFFAQFVDHNLVTTPEEETERFDIEVPAGDDTLAGIRTELEFLRSVRANVDGGSIERPMNALSSPFDLVAVYGAFDMRNFELRGFDDIGRLNDYLKTSGDDLLPLNENEFVNAPNTSDRFFLAGDHRSNEHPALTAFHTLFLREHNRLVKLIRDTVGDAPSNVVYQAARAMNIAQFQKIVFEQFYPVAVGKQLPPYGQYQPDVNPTVSDVFSGAAYRFGHTMVSDTVPRRDKHGKELPPIPMAELFFRPANTFSSQLMNDIIRGTAHTPAQEVDTWVVDALRNQLFINVDGVNGFDLVAMNIQRGRDHALPSYNDLREMFGIPRANFFSEITTDREVAARLTEAYKGKVDDVDAFVGLLAEEHEPGSTFGKTMNAVWEAEFLRLRDGDQFLYLLKDKFPQLVIKNFEDWIKKVQRPGTITLADIIVQNTPITRDQLPEDIFKAPPATPTATPSDSIQIFVRSEGFDDGNSATIEVNSQSVFEFNGTPFSARRGMNVAIVDAFNGDVLLVETFDTFLSSSASTMFATLVAGARAGQILIVSVKDEASRNLGEDAKDALKAWGSEDIDELEFRDSWCFVVHIEEEEIEVRESLEKQGSGTAEILWELPIATPGPAFVDVFARSEGFEDGNDAVIEVDSTSVFSTENGLPSPRRGINAAVIDEDTGKVLSVRNFDTFGKDIDNEKFQEFLNGLRAERILVLAVKDEASRRLNSFSRQLLKDFGSERIDELQFRDSWCMITRVGYPEYLLNEALVKRSSGAAEVHSRRLRLRLDISSATPDQ